MTCLRGEMQNGIQQRLAAAAHMSSSMIQGHMHKVNSSKAETAEQSVSDAGRLHFCCNVPADSFGSLPPAPEGVVLLCWLWSNRLRKRKRIVVNCVGGGQ